ncbi:hypothetical protein H696_02423 [Fonticula alba]|uniref:Kinesin motor domain-containing protein n=1 Tax=Fonticula alba TaxID=691883 RepID=A0A058ZDG2_FONAL|nr:hypothetical protein H696_02423 [Fonticula alba]KCV71477.1 hypothetical protein H696_02423 [Fonticula alba]|eukprot:XP_009494600.1 hypothetical protein H696_02423 [Fonticula alba]
MTQGLLTEPPAATDPGLPSNADPDGGDTSSVKVAVRIRPLGDSELEAGAISVVTRAVPRGGVGLPVVINGRDRVFAFDYVFDSNHSQEDLYGSCVAPLVEAFMDGYNATVFAYGQTGSGKTYTMGSDSGSLSSITAPRPSQDAAFDDVVLPTHAPTTHLGILPRAVFSIFEQIDRRRAEAQQAGSPAPSFEVGVSFLELYNEEFIDLLQPRTRELHMMVATQRPGEMIRLKDDPATGGVELLGAREEYVESALELLALVSLGAQSRTTASTDMNLVSSRSHAIASITLRQKRYAGGAGEPQTPGAAGSGSGAATVEFITSKFHLVDLAGSERLKKTNAVGERAKEGININMGLLALGNVISALGDEARRSSFIPYRDSKLTRLLQNSLGGNSKTLMIACVSPADANAAETTSTLHYASRARNIKNVVSVQQLSVGDGPGLGAAAVEELFSLRRQVVEMRAELRALKGGIGMPAPGRPSGSGFGMRGYPASPATLMSTLSVSSPGGPGVHAAGATADLLARLQASESERRRLEALVASLRDRCADLAQQVARLRAVEEPHLFRSQQRRRCGSINDPPAEDDMRPVDAGAGELGGPAAGEPTAPEVDCASVTVLQEYLDEITELRGRLAMSEATVEDLRARQAAELEELDAPLAFPLDERPLDINRVKRRLRKMERKLRAAESAAESVAPDTPAHAAHSPTMMAVGTSQAGDEAPASMVVDGEQPALLAGGEDRMPVEQGALDAASLCVAPGAEPVGVSTLAEAPCDVDDYDRATEGRRGSAALNHGSGTDDDDDDADEGADDDGEEDDSDGEGDCSFSSSVNGMIQSMVENPTENSRQLLSQFAQIKEDIMEKAQLVTELERKEVELSELRYTFSERLNELTAEKNRLILERDNALIRIKQSAKPGEQRAIEAERDRHDQRIRQLTEQIADLRSKYQANQKVLRSKLKIEEHMPALKASIATLEQQRRDLIIKMRAEQRDHLRERQLAAQEIKVLQKREMQSSGLIGKLQRNIEQKEGQLRRRTEEAISAREKLRVLDRSRYLTKPRASENIPRIKSSFDAKLKDCISLRELEAVLSRLTQRRNSLVTELSRLQRELDQAPGPDVEDRLQGAQRAVEASLSACHSRITEVQNELSNQYRTLSDDRSRFPSSSGAQRGLFGSPKPSSENIDQPQVFMPIIEIYTRLSFPALRELFKLLTEDLVTARVNNRILAAQLEQFRRMAGAGATPPEAVPTPRPAAAGPDISHLQRSIAEQRLAVEMRASKIAALQAQLTGAGPSASESNLLARPSSGTPAPMAIDEAMLPGLGGHPANMSPGRSNSSNTITTSAPVNRQTLQRFATLVGHTGGVTQLALGGHGFADVADIYGPDGPRHFGGDAAGQGLSPFARSLDTQLFSSGRDGTVRLWDVALASGGAVLAQSDGPIHSLAAVGNFAFYLNDEGIGFVDARAPPHSPLSGDADAWSGLRWLHRPVTMAVAPDGRYLLTPSGFQQLSNPTDATFAEHGVAVWDVRMRRPLNGLRGGFRDAPCSFAVVPAGGNVMHGLTARPALMLCASRDRIVRAYDLASLDLVSTFHPPHHDAVSTVFAGPADAELHGIGGETVAYSSGGFNSGFIKLWQLAAGSRAGHENPLSTSQVARDGGDATPSWGFVSRLRSSSLTGTRPMAGEPIGGGASGDASSREISFTAEPARPGPSLATRDPVTSSSTLGTCRTIVTGHRDGSLRLWEPLARAAAASSGPPSRGPSPSRAAANFGTGPNFTTQSQPRAELPGAHAGPVAALVYLADQSM